MTRGLRSGATALVLLLAVAGCMPEGSGASRAGGATPAPTEVRHDLEPLTTRFPALADPVSAIGVGRSGWIFDVKTNMADVASPSIRTGVDYTGFPSITFSVAE